MLEGLPPIGDVAEIEVDGLTIRHARTTGSGDHLPILMTSPWPESIYAFRDVIPRLGKTRHIIAIDLPGFGHSQGRRDLMSPKAMGAFVVKAMGTLGLGRVHAVGPDVGALSLLFAAAALPDIFESLIVGSGATSVRLAAGGLVDLILSPEGAFQNAEGGDLGSGYVRSAAARHVPPAVLDDYRRSSAGARFEIATNFVRAYPEELPELQSLLPTIKTPVLVLAGRNDPLVPPANGQLLADLLPRNRYTLLEGGHLIWEDAAEAYAEAITAWVGDGYLRV